jgi:phosphomannomutase
VGAMITASKTKSDDNLFKVGVLPTIPEIAKGFGISEDAARALVEAGLRSIRDQSQHSRLSLCHQ